MKNRKSITLAVTLAGSALVGIMPQTVSAEIGEDVPAAIAAMQDKDWAQAKGLYDKIIKENGERGKALYGGKFGFIYYNKGYTELQLAKQIAGAGGKKNLEQSKKMYEAAKQSFNMCRKFPTDDKGENQFFFKALLYLGQAEQALNECKEAIAHYKKFIADRDPEKRGEDTYHIGMFNINMAICHFKLEKPALAEGLVYYETALKNKDKMRVPDAAIVSAFKDFAAAAIVDNKEKMMVDFVNNNRGVLTLDPYQMYQFIPFFRKYAAEAFSKDMVDGAFTLYALMPGTIETEEDLSVYDKDLIGYTRAGVADGFINRNARQSVGQIQGDLKHIQKSIKDGEPHELLALRSLAFTHESEGYVRGAYNAYKSMENYYPKTKGREDNLYNLVRTSSLIGEVMETEKFGRLFLKRFPDSQYVDSVKNMMLISLFYTGEYEVAYKVSSELIEDLAENTKPHDLCLHVLGGSMFYLGKFYDADEFLKKHVKMYPESEYKIAARYFVASNYSRLEDWENAATYLDKFLADYPDPNVNAYIPFALFDRANTHFAEEQYDEAIAILDKIETDFPSSAVEDISFNLRGDVHRAKGEKAKANDYYVKALNLSKKQGSDIVSEESLYKLVALHGNEKEGKEPNPNIKDAIPYYDEFWKDRQDSVYKTQVAVAGVPALTAAGRGDEGLANVQSVISEMAKLARAPGMEQAINTYGKYYLQSGKSPEQLKTHFEDFPDVDAGDKRAQALLRIAVIGVYEDLIKDAEKGEDQASLDKVGLLKAKIDAMFNDMDSKFEKTELSDFILMRLADFIAERTGNPRKAIPYYDEVLGRNTNQFRTMAQFGKAGILAKSDQAAEQNQALETLKDVLSTKDIGRDTKERATYSIVEVYNNQENWKELINQAVIYNQEGYSTKNKSRVSLLLAKAYENEGNKSKALAVYASVYTRYKSDWAISIPALTKAAEFTRSEGKEFKGKSPKQIAYDMAAQFIRDSTRAYDENKLKMPPEVRKSWEDLRDQVQRWEDEAGIKSLEQQKKELEASR
ncbi:MAG: tetratricopeptide repeat protein [Akkermansiaceae bacterium]